MKVGLWLAVRKGAKWEDLSLAELFQSHQSQPGSVWSCSESHTAETLGLSAWRALFGATIPGLAGEPAGVWDLGTGVWGKCCGRWRVAVEEVAACARSFRVYATFCEILGYCAGVLVAIQTSGNSRAGLRRPPGLGAHPEESRFAVFSLG